MLGAIARSPDLRNVAVENKYSFRHKKTPGGVKCGASFWWVFDRPKKSYA
jgi:hypothetical protein